MLLGALLVVLEAARVFLVHLEAGAILCLGIFIVGVVEQLCLFLRATLDGDRIAVPFTLTFRGASRHVWCCGLQCDDTKKKLAEQRRGQEFDKSGAAATRVCWALTSVHESGITS